MFGRRRRGAEAENPSAQAQHKHPAVESAASVGPVGIGAVVTVIPEPGSPDEWEGEPSGVIVAPGDNEIVGYPGLSLGSPRRWLVVFDELSYMKDGRGPFEQATVLARQLRPIAVVEDVAMPYEEG